jgi:catechol 2,3-dioxygenase-like lactoylglutathione lyase family enzyme
MKITGMNHFNVLTDDVDATRRFYVGILGLTEGERPPFKFPGLWLYAAVRPILHVSGARLAQRSGPASSTISPSARPTSRAPVARLKEHGVEHTLNQQVGSGIWQIFCHDPMGAKVELDFDPSEPAP